MTRRMVERHVWQDALDDVIAFTKSEIGKRIYNWRKETIERSFAEAKVNHGLRYARMLGIQNMREQSFLTAAVQNIKRLVASYFSPFFAFLSLPLVWRQALSMLCILISIRIPIGRLPPTIFLGAAPLKPLMTKLCKGAF